MARKRDITSAAMIREMTSRWSPFPNKTLGYYDYFSQTIHLDTVDSAKMEAAFKTGDFAARLEVFPLLTHEMQHLVDHTASVWGRDLLVRLFDVYAARVRDDLSEFPRITAMMRKLKTTDLSDYYTHYADLAFEPWDGKRWRYQFSVGCHLGPDGRQIEERPIIFTRFMRNEDGEYICRVPLSIASLLEVRAIAAEMVATMALFKAAGNDPVRMIDRDNWAQKLSGMFYDGSLALYTVAAHCFANRLNLSDPFETYTKASALAWLCLNMPPQFFPPLRIPDHFSDFGTRNEAMRANGDRGYLYLALLENGRGVPTEDMDAWMDGALRRSGLPSLIDVMTAAEAERQRAAGQMAANPFQQRLDDMLALGRHYAAVEGKTWGKNFLLGSGRTPPFLLSDNRFVSLAGAPTTGSFSNPEGWLWRAHSLYRQLREFVDACIV